MDGEVVVQVLGDEVIDKAPDGRADVGGQDSVLSFDLLLPHVVGSEFGLCLTFEVRFLNLDADGTHDALAAVSRLVVLLEEILEGLGDGLAVCGQMEMRESQNLILTRKC